MSTALSCDDAVFHSRAEMKTCLRTVMGCLAGNGLAGKQVEFDAELVDAQVVVTPGGRELPGFSFHEWAGELVELCVEVSATG